MNYYAMQVKTRSEDTYIKLALLSVDREPSGAVRLLFPRRKMPVRKRGAMKSELQPVFPGYVFLEVEGELSTDLYWSLRTTPGFFRFLPENALAKPLEGRDLSMLRHFLSFGPVAESSKVTFDAQDRIQVVSGPLKGLEGRIIKVDKRKGRAKIKLDLYDESFLIDLAFEQIGQH
jgi:transcription termination/antitermination protein NusG